jgi:membrane protein DedA with SNARE-associated domain
LATASRPRPSRRTLTFLVAPIVVLVVIGWVGNAIHPALIDPESGHPLLLIAMEPRFRWMVLVANRVDYVPFIVVSTVRRLLSDPLFYLLGYYYGDAAVDWLKKRFDSESGGIVDTVERLFRKAAPVMVFLYPGIFVCVLAGATGMSPVAFVVLNVTGTAVTGTGTYLLADAIRGPVESITNFYGDNTRWLLVVSIALTGLWLLDQWRRGKTDVQALAHLDEEMGAAGPGGPGEQEGAS